MILPPKEMVYNEMEALIYHFKLVFEGVKVPPGEIYSATEGANGDERGFGPQDREGVSPDDMYFGRFRQMRFAPVKDDILSTGLPTVAQ